MLRVRTVVTGVPGSPYYSNFYFGGTTSGEAAAALAATKGFWNSLTSTLRSGSQSTVQGDVVQIDPITGSILTLYSLTNGIYNNTNSNPLLPPTSQAVIRLRSNTFLGGREVRGRWFVGALCSDANTAGVLSGPVTTALNSANTALLSASAGAGQLVVWSRKNQSVAFVTGLQVWNQFGSLRSRRD